MALNRALLMLVISVLFFVVGLEATIIECEEESSVSKTVAPSKSGIAHASFCAEIRPPPMLFAEIPIRGRYKDHYCSTQHLCEERYFWWWNATHPDEDIYTIHVQIRGVDEKDAGVFPITIFTNDYKESLTLTVEVSDKGDAGEPNASEKVYKQQRLAECADADAKSSSSGGQKCPSGWLPVGDDLCVMNELGHPLNFPLATESCELFGATLVQLDRVNRIRSRRAADTGEEEEEDGYEKDGAWPDEEELFDEDEFDDEVGDFADEEDDDGVREEDGEGAETGSQSSELEEEDEADEADGEIEEGGEEGGEEGKSTDDDKIDDGEEMDEEDEVDEDSAEEEEDSDQTEEDEKSEKDVVEELEEAEQEKDKEGDDESDTEKPSKSEKVLHISGESHQYSINTCLNARLAVLADKEELWASDSKDPSACLSYNSVTKKIDQERTCHFVYNRFTCLFDSSKHRKPTITKFQIQFHHEEGDHNTVSFNVSKSGTQYHEVRDGVTSATIVCEASGYPKPDVVIMEGSSVPVPQYLHPSPHTYNITDEGVFLGRFACVASNIFGEEAEIRDLQLWRYQPPHRVRLVVTGVLVLLILIIVVAALVVLNRYRAIKFCGSKCLSFFSSCRCFICPQRRPRGSARVPTDIFPPSQDYVYGDAWADEVPLYVRQARSRSPSTTKSSGTIYKQVKEQEQEQEQQT